MHPFTAKHANQIMEERLDEQLVELESILRREACQGKNYWRTGNYEKDTAMKLKSRLENRGFKVKSRLYDLGTRELVIKW